jgi:hypothetical protein
MASVTGDENGEGEVMGCSHFWRGKRGRRRGRSTVLKANNTKKSSAVAGEVEGGGWRVEVEDDQRKLSRWAECVVGSNC